MFATYLDKALRRVLGYSTSEYYKTS